MKTKDTRSPKVDWTKNEREEIARKELGKPPSARVSEVSGLHEAHGIGNVVGLDIVGPAILRPGTRSVASGIGNVTGTRIGGSREED